MKITNKKKLLVFIVGFSALYVAEKVFLKANGASDFVLTMMLWPLTGGITLWLLCDTNDRFSSLGRWALPTANLVYYLHPAFILVANELYNAVAGAELPNEVCFIATSVVLTLVGLIVSKNKLGRKVLCG